MHGDVRLSPGCGAAGGASSADALVAGPDGVTRWRQDSLAAWRTAVAQGDGEGQGSGGAPWGRVEAGLADKQV